MTKIKKFPSWRLRTDVILIFFLAITRVHIVRLRRNLEFGGLITRIQRLILGDENVQFRKSNIEDGHFENHYISISQRQIVRISRNLVCRQKFYPRGRKRDTKFRNSQIQNGGWTTHWKSLFGYNSAACCPIKMKFGVSRQNHTHTKQIRWSNA